jgi:hypothetical protein
MDRRDTIKSMLIGSLAGGLILSGCAPEGEEKKNAETPSDGLYGRTPKEKERDLRVMGETFFTDHEIATVSVLCDLILPATATAGSAVQAGVPEFITFIVKDMKSHQVPLRGGLMWLDHRSMILFEKAFIECTPDQQKQMLHEIAWPDTAVPEVAQGVTFFNRMRNLVLTGYYTTRMGIDDLGYQGNTPNVWDGVPEAVLAKHGLSYDPEWLAKCVDQDKRDVLAEWDAEGNLLT